MITRLGKAAKMPFGVHPQMPRMPASLNSPNDGHETRCSNATLTSEPPWTVFRSAQVENGIAIPVVHLKARSARVPSGL